MSDARDDAIHALPERLVRGAAHPLRADLVRWVREARGELVLDASAVQAVDGAGLQLLIACRHAMAREGGSLTLARCSRALADALALTGQRWGLSPGGEAERP